MGSLKNQFIRVINESFTPGLNKHSYKKQKVNKQKIPSYRYRKNLIDFSCNLSNYLTANYSIKYVKEIKPEHITAFFKEKELRSNNGKGCAHATLIQYKSYINKLDKLIKQTYKFNAHLVEGVPKKLGGNSKIRNLYLKQEHIYAILEEKSDSISDAVLGIKINNLFGLRAEEATKLKKINGFTIIIKTDKGVWYMSRKDKVLVLYDKYNDLIGTVVFNKITKESEYDILLDDNIVKIIIDNRRHKLINCFGNTYKIITTEEIDLDK